MKKYFLMLAVALVMPLLFTSCGNDDPEPEPEPQPEVTFPYAFPNCNWGSAISSVKASMANAGLDLTIDNATSLVYRTTDGFFPAYTYLFTDGALTTSSLTLSEDQDAEYDFQGEIEKKFGQAVDEDDEGWYYVKDETTVYYTYDEESKGWQALFTRTTRADKSTLKQLAKENAALLKSVK